MKYLGVSLAVGITAVIVLTLGVFNFLLGSEPEIPLGIEAAAAPIEETAVISDPAAIQAAFSARETLLQAQITGLDAEMTDRQSNYERQVEEMSTLIAAGEKRLAELQDQETVIQVQLDQLRTAQTERVETYEGQRQQAYYQYQLNIQQLQTQLDEANAKLFEARARLGQ